MKYSLIYADPAWEYGNTISNGAAENHYAKVKPLGVSFIKFVSVIGRLNGRYGVDS